jgi:hypothetical protein
MRKKYTCSRRISAVFALAICAVAFVLLVRRSLALDRIAWLAAANSSSDALTRQVTALSDFGDADLVALRSKSNAYQSRLGSEGIWSELEKNYGGSWSIESGAKHENGGSLNQTGILTKISPTVGDWQTAVDTLGTLEHLPGVAIARFEMKTSGDLEHRSVDMLKIVIAINAHRTPSEVTIR